MKLIMALAVSIPLLAADTTRSRTELVTAIRHWSLTDVTRVAVEISGEFEFHTDRLHNPERVYFDILNSRPRLESHLGLAEELDDKLLKRIRVAQTVPGVTRVV